MDFHPLLVHFPIALLLAAGFFECLSAASRRDDFSRVGWWNQLLGTIGLGAAVASGIRAGGMGHPQGETLLLLELHQQLAFAASAVFAGLLLWRLSSRTRLPGRGRWAYALLFAGGLALLLGTAWYGGELVFRHGTGVTALPGAPPPP